MKKTVNVAIGGLSFTIDEDAYNALGSYLDKFRSALGDATGKQEVMDELEIRIAELFRSQLGGREVVDIALTRSVISQMGMPDGSAETESDNNNNNNEKFDNMETVRKFYRDADDKKIGGVCSGLALYLNIDVVILRVIFLVALFCGTAGFWIYLVLCIVAPCAKTPTEKCEMRGIPATAENIQRFARK